MHAYTSYIDLLQGEHLYKDVCQLIPCIVFFKILHSYNSVQHYMQHSDQWDMI